MDANKVVIINGRDLTPEQIAAVAIGKATVRIDKIALQKATHCREALLEAVQQGGRFYGVTLECGDFQNRTISGDKIKQYQINYILAHSCGHGEPLSEEVVRGAMLVRANNFLVGHSGVAISELMRLIDCLNKGVYPVVASVGSLGASGDLIQLSEMTMAILGYEDGRLFWQGKQVSAKKALPEYYNLKPMDLEIKGAMAFTNGITFSTAAAALSYMEIRDLWFLINLSSSLVMEASRGHKAAFHKTIGEVRRHPGQIHSAWLIRKLTAGSRRATAEAREVFFPDEEVGEKSKVHNAYSIRCAAQILTPLFTELKMLKECLLIDANCAGDNPLVFITKNGKIILRSSGNFHGQLLAQRLDSIKIALAVLGSEIASRIHNILNPSKSSGLPAQLAAGKGENGGMIWHYLSVALSAELKTKSMPAQIFTMPTSQGQEDHNSMSWTAARQLMTMIPQLRALVALELLMGSRGIEMTQPLLPKDLRSLGQGTTATNQIILSLDKMKNKPFFERFRDKCIKQDLAIVEEWLRDGKILNIVEKKIGDAWKKGL